MTADPDPASYVVDTSVAVKWYVERDEADTAKALRLLAVHSRGQCTLRAPQFLLFEVANALLKGHQLGASVVLEALNQLWNLEMELDALRRPTLAKAVEIAARCEATIYDSYFLALALETRSVLVTADEAFLRKARHYPSVVSLRQLRLPVEHGPTS